MDEFAFEFPLQAISWDFPDFYSCMKREHIKKSDSEVAYIFCQRGKRER